jgi:hypothetical protein
MTTYHSPANPSELRHYASEWRKRGLTPPDDLDALVRARIAGRPTRAREAVYADFFKH